MPPKRPSFKVIRLHRKGRVIVDTDDYERACKIKWRLHPDNYAFSRVRGRTVYLHRMINRTPEGMDTDHINGNGLDNRKRNLRSCTRAQNMWNAAVRKSSATLRGAHFYKRHQKWKSAIRVNYKQIHLGYFATAKEAHAAYVKAAKEHHGEFHRATKRTR
jgi:hypothetical protein